MVVTVPLVALAIPSLVIGYFTIQPALYGDWFGASIHVDDANNVLTALAPDFHGALTMGLHGFTQLPFWLMFAAFLICTYVYLINPAMAGKIKGALKPLWTVPDRK